MSQDRSRAEEALVLKRSNVGESDRIVTLLTKHSGKIACIAKGVRKVTSSKRAYLEPGNHVKILLINTHSMPLLTQASLLDDCRAVHGDLGKIRQLVQVLEIIDTLFVEEHSEPELFNRVIDLRNHLMRTHVSNAHVKQELSHLIAELGYQDPQETKYSSILEYVSTLAEKPMKSWDYLKVE